MPYDLIILNVIQIFVLKTLGNSETAAMFGNCDPIRIDAI